MSNKFVQTNIGYIPMGWKPCKVGELVSFSGGSQPDKSVFKFRSAEGYIRLIQIRDYKTDKYESYIPEGLARKTCDESDVMVGRYGPPIFQILRGIKGAYNVALIKAIPSDVLDKDFFYHFIQNEDLFSLMEVLSRRSSGQTGVDLPALKDYPLPLPPKKEQAAIAKTLSDTDALITSLEKLIVKKRAIKTATMQQLLTGKKRLSPFDKNHTGYKQTELGEIPEDWGIAELSKFVGALDAGISVNSAEDKAAFGHGKAILKTSCISDGYFYPDEAKGIVPEDLARARLNPTKGNIIISRMNTPDLVGEIGYVAEDHENLFLPDRLWQTKYRSNESVCGRWLAFILSYPDIAKQIKESATGTSNSMKNISKSSLLATLLPAPSFDEQEAVAGFLSDIDNDLGDLNKRLIKTQNLKQGMMQELLTGKTRLVAGEV